MSSTKILIIGERMHSHNSPDANRTFNEDIDEWARMSLRLGAFGDVQRAKLRDVGIPLPDRYGTPGCIVDTVNVLGTQVEISSANLLPPHPNVSTWSASEAVEAAWALMHVAILRNYTHVGLCGAKVVRAVTGATRVHVGEWNEADLKSRTTSEIGRVRLMCLPHPSGLNRWWNEMENRETLLENVRAWMGLREPSPVIGEIIEDYA